MSNVFELVANAAGYTGNNQLKSNSADIPPTNISGPIPGPLNPAVYVPFAAQDVNATCRAPGAKVFVAQGVNLSQTAASLPSPVNLTALNQDVPAAGPFNASATAPAAGPSNTNGGSGGNTSGAVNMVANLVFSILIAGIAVAFTF